MYINTNISDDSDVDTGSGIIESYSLEPLSSVDSLSYFPVEAESDSSRLENTDCKSNHTYHCKVTPTARECMLQ